MTDHTPIPTPRRPIPGLPRWADLEPTIGELAATVSALPELRAALAAATTAHDTAKAALTATNPPTFQPPANDDLDVLIDAVVAYENSHNPEQATARDAFRRAADLRRSLERMVLFANGHELHDGIPVRVARTTVFCTRIQIASSAIESRRYVEAEKFDGRWQVELGDLDTPRGYDPVVEIADEVEVLRVGLDHVLAPLRALAAAQ